MMGLNEIAAEIHRRMCEDDRFGYSWEERYGATWETWTIGGRDYRIKMGDYDYPWDGILHFVGDGDGGCEAPAGEPAAAAGSTEDLPMPRFRVAVMIEDEKTWLDWMCGMSCECGRCGDTYGGIPGVGIVDIEFDGGSLGPNGWLTKNMKGDKLIGLTVYYDTPNPEEAGYYQAMYRVHWMGRNAGWGKWEYDDGDGGAGNDRDQLDMVEVTIVRC